MPDGRWQPPPMDEDATERLRKRVGGGPPTMGPGGVRPSLTTQEDIDARALRIARDSENSVMSRVSRGYYTQTNTARRFAASPAGGLARSMIPGSVEDLVAMGAGSLLEGPAGAIAGKIGRGAEVIPALARVIGATAGGYGAAQLTGSSPGGTAALEGGAEALGFGVEAVNRRFAILPRLYYALKGSDPGEGLVEGAAHYAQSMRNRGERPTLGQILDPMKNQAAYLRLESAVENTVGTGASGILRKAQMGTERAARAELRMFVDDLLKPTGRITDRADVASIVQDALSQNSATFATMRSHKYAAVDALAQQPLVNTRDIRNLVNRYRRKVVAPSSDPVGNAFLKDLDALPGVITFEQADWLRKNINDMVDRGDTLLGRRGDNLPKELTAALNYEMEQGILKAHAPPGVVSAQSPNWRQTLLQSWQDAKDFHARGSEAFGNDFIATLIRKDPDQAARLIIPDTGELSATNIRRLNEALNFSTAQGVVPASVMRDVRSNILARVISKSSETTSIFHPRADISRLDPSDMLERIKKLDEEGGLSELIGSAEASRLKYLVRNVEIAQRRATKVLQKEAGGAPSSSIWRWGSASLTGSAIGTSLYLVNTDSDSRDAGGISGAALKGAAAGVAANYVAMRFGTRAIARMLSSDEMFRLMVDASGMPGTKTASRAMSRLMLRAPAYLGMQWVSDNPEELQIIRPGEENSQ